MAEDACASYVECVFPTRGVIRTNKYFELSNEKISLQFVAGKVTQISQGNILLPVDEEIIEITKGRSGHYLLNPFEAPQVISHTGSIEVTFYEGKIVDMVQAKLEDVNGTVIRTYYVTKTGCEELKKTFKLHIETFNIG